MRNNLTRFSFTFALALVAFSTPAPASAQTVVLGHAIRGRVVVAHDTATTFTDAARRAQAIEPSGWDILIRSTTPGYGAAFCAGSAANRNIRIFVSEGHATAREATVAARELARPYAAQLREVSWICGGGGGWRNSNTHPPEPTPRNLTTFGVRG